MQKIQFFAFLIGFVYCEHQLGEPGLHFDQTGAYASTYTNYAPHNYAFEYGVSDPHTGDHKSQWETRDKGVVRGGYSLLEPDGTTRIVEYVADDDGFRAVVKKLGTALHPEKVEVHGAESAEVIQPQITSELVPESHYQSYDGDVHNYENVLGAALQHLEPVSYQQPIEIPHSVDYHGFNVEYQPQPLYFEQTVPSPPVNAPSQSLVPDYINQHQLPLAQSYITQNHYHQNVAPSVVPVLQSSGEYHVLTGNDKDDSDYTKYEDGSANDEYGEYSEKKENFAAQPQYLNSAERQQFVIFYPSTGSHK